ncbi:hypothetical protein BASA62_008781 [Batrachochytrium salamandrivorans]|nr:hypothetical protein BASA62_008781 [Batrachochytrium salamandrivorans]
MDSVQGSPVSKQHSTSRVFIHLDLDAFYAQVEQVRLGLPASTPLCVQQWHGIIAVNYAARSSGIQRFCTAAEAKQKCPELQLVHVATFADGDAEAKYHTNPLPKSHKVSLDVYRQASSKIMAILSECGSLFEPASIDEAYIDVTDQVNEIIDSGKWRDIIRDYQAEQECDLEVKNDIDDIPGSRVYWSTETHGATGVLETSKGIPDLQLCIGAYFSKTIRKQIFDQLGYTCSTGISHNKLLSKLISATNKPNKQTVLRGDLVLEFMKEIAILKIPGFGGKLGKKIVDAFKVDKAHQLWEYTQNDLVKQLGYDHGVFLYNSCRGIDNSKLRERGMPASMIACKSLREAVHSSEKIVHWLGILSTELFSRVHDGYKINKRWPKILSLRCRNQDRLTSKSKSCAFPSRGQFISPDSLCTKAWGLFQAEEDKYPCVYLSLSATKLSEMDDPCQGVSKWLLKGSRTNDISDNMPEMTTTTEGLVDGDVAVVNGLSHLIPDKEPHPVLPVSPQPREITGFQEISNMLVADPSIQESTTWGSEFGIECTQCHLRILADDASQQEHADMHVAASLAREWSNEAQSQRSLAPKSRLVTKKVIAGRSGKGSRAVSAMTPSALASGSQSTTLTNFFKKKE